jgi:hypothetical protein
MLNERDAAIAMNACKDGFRRLGDEALDPRDRTLEREGHFACVELPVPEEEGVNPSAIEGLSL